MSETTIVWFRRDLRLTDNAALCEAVKRGSVVPVYIFAPHEEAPWAPGAASRWWLHHSLNALDRSLRELGASLEVVQGDTIAQLLALCRRHRASAVYWNRLYEPVQSARDAQVRTALNDSGINTRDFSGHLLYEPWEVLRRQGTPYKVYTPYSRACMAMRGPRWPLPPPQKLLFPPQNRDRSIKGIDALRLLPRIRWDSGIDQAWTPGEHAALNRLTTFVDQGLGQYPSNRDIPGVDGTSGLSPYLHFGEVSPATVWHTAATSADANEDALHSYLRQLLWREFAHHLLFHFPQIDQHNFKPSFDPFPWVSPDRQTRIWQQGQTGIPIVDAGMRELWHTGYMHNRVRMLVASFLTKNLLTDWRTGARWFWDTLVDADLANNTMGWQWVAGSGPDAAPYFRIFNPVTQSRKFDSDGTYIRRWVPELQPLPDGFLHAPWEAPHAILEHLGVRLGREYPEPVVNLKRTRERALRAYKSLRKE